MPNRRHHDSALGRRKPVLHRGPLAVLHAGMIRPRRKTGLGQSHRHLFGRALKRDIDDRRPGRPRTQAIQQRGVTILGRDWSHQ